VDEVRGGVGQVRGEVGEVRGRGVGGEWEGHIISSHTKRGSVKSLLLNKEMESTKSITTYQGSEKRHLLCNNNIFDICINFNIYLTKFQKKNIR
jgi:hypothetical protein